LRRRRKSLFYIPKHEKISDRMLLSRLTLSALTVGLCLVLLCTTTLALFADSVTSGSNVLEAATFDVVVTDGNGNPISLSGPDADGAYVYTCGLSCNDTHTFKFTAAGTASKGYCVIEADGVPIYTDAILSGGMPFGLTFTAGQHTQIKFTPVWGTRTSSTLSLRDMTASDGDIIYISETPHEIYMVEEGATLQALSEHYGVAVEDILLYNGITELQTGDMIKIPGTAVTEPYTVPVEETKDSEESENADAGEESEVGGEGDVEDSSVSSEEPSEPDAPASQPDNQAQPGEPSDEPSDVPSGQPTEQPSDNPGDSPLPETPDAEIQVATGPEPEKGTQEPDKEPEPKPEPAEPAPQEEQLPSGEGNTDEVQ